MPVTPSKISKSTGCGLTFRQVATSLGDSVMRSRHSRQTNSLPIVFAQVGDPVKLRVVAILALLQKPLGSRLSRSGVRDAPSPFVDIELHQTFISHFQEEGLASFFIHDIGAFHHLVQFERLLAERAQDIFSIIQHD